MVIEHWSEHQTFEGWSMDIISKLEEQIGLAIAHKKQQSQVQHLSSFVEQTQDAILVTDKDGTIQYVNESFTRFTGFDPKDIIGKKPSVLQSGAYDKGFYKTLWQTILTGEPVRDEVLNRKRSGELYYHDLVISPITDASGRITHFISSGRDITEKQRNLDQIQRREEKFRALFENSTEAILILEDGKIAHSNDRALDLFDTSADELIGKELHELSPVRQQANENSRIRMEEILKRATNDDPREFQWKYVTTDGVLFDAQVGISPLTQWGGNFLQVIIRDISENKQLTAAQDAIFKVSQAAQSSADLEEMYGIIHEAIKDLLPAENFYIALADKDTGKLTLPYFADEYDSPPDEDAIHGGITEYVFRRGDPFLLSRGNVRQLAKEGDIILKGKLPVDWFGVPLQAEDDIIGVMVVQSYNLGVHYTDREIELLTFVSDQIASVIAKKRAQEKAAEEHQLLSVMLKSIGDGVIAVDTSCNVILMNDRALELTGWDEDEAHHNNLKHVLTVIDESTGRPISMELNPDKEGYCDIPEYATLISKSGRRYNIALSAAPMENDAGESLGTIVAFHDITTLRNLEDEVYKAKALKSVSRLAAGLAHDFNNILTGILGNISLARLIPENNTKVEELLENAEISAENARKLTQQILNYPYGDNPSFEKLNISEILFDSASFALSEPQNAEIEIETNLWPIRVDPGQISHVFKNLLLNADQAQDGTGTIQVKASNVIILPSQLSMKMSPGPYISVKITDSGSGMTADEQKHIFEPYYSTRKDATGLGLTTSRTYVEKHLGHLKVESSPGKGTSVTVYLPAMPEGIQEDSTFEEESAQDIPRGDERILVMEYESQVRYSLTVMLEELGYKVEAVADGDIAGRKYLEAYDNGNPFDAVILDLTVPGGKGASETIKRLKFIDSNVRAIVSSGYLYDPTMAEYEMHGFAGKVVKPFNISELANTLRDVLDLDIN
jgi:PAS domain S-box-containing protein